MLIVPTIDITPYVTDGSEAERAAVARQVDEAARTVGFMQILGHRVADEVLAGLADAIDAFFGMDLESKRAFVRPPSENRGYTPPKSESLSYSLGVETSRMKDFFEAYNVGASVDDHPGLDLPEAHYARNTWPTIPDRSEAFRAQVSAYYAEAERVARTLVRVFADAMGVDPDYLAGLEDHSLDVLRLNNYALPPSEVSPDADLTGMGEHTDYGIVTVLWADQVEGLQVLGSDSVWYDVLPADGALLVNLGDVTARLTNDEWMSTLHRVKPPIVDGTIRRRRSAAFFHDGNTDAVVGPLPQFLGEGREPHYEPVTVAEHVAAKLAGSRAGIKNVSAVREAARVVVAQR